CGQNACNGTYTITSSYGGECTGTATSSTPGGSCGVILNCGGWGGEMGMPYGCEDITQAQFNECSALSNSSSCNANNNCVWTSTDETTTCSSFNGGFNFITNTFTMPNPSACENFGCDWDQETISETRHCSDFTTES